MTVKSCPFEVRLTLSLNQFNKALKTVINSNNEDKLQLFRCHKLQ